MSEALTAPPATTDAPIPIDDAGVPITVRQQAKAADDLIRQMREAANNPQPAPEATPTPAPTPAPAPAPTPDADALAKAEQEARTWRGRAEAADRRATATANEVAELRAAVEALRAAPPPAPAPVAPVARALTDEEIENLGPDLVDAIARHSQNIIAPMIDAAVERALTAMRGEIAPVKQQVERVAKTTEQTVDERFVAALDGAITNWRAIDTDPAFHAWAAEYDPLIGRTRKESLDGAVATRDNARVIAFFRAFLNQRGATASQGADTPPGTPPADAPGNPPAADAGQDEPPPSLADLAAPGGTRSGDPAPTGGGPRIWKMSEIREHASKIARGLYTDPAEKDRVDRAIAAAQREGRVDFAR